MHVALRGLGLVLLLLSAWSGAASAMDPSATEETNCLMACDANQEHCASTPHVATPRNYSAVAPASPLKIKALISSRRPVEAR
jgi:hypothetical protein